MSDIKEIFKKVDGFRVLKEYAKSHVLFHAFLMTAIEGTSRKSLEIVRESVNNRIVNRLRKKYNTYIANFKNTDIERKKLPREHSNKVWICWLQGIENAPEIVKKCYFSLRENLEDRDIVLLTEDNYRDWVSFPVHIQKKIEDGIITRTHMTDFLRLELLEHYGGTWIDATVFCSGKNIPDYIWNSDLFLYQIMKPGLDAHAQRTSTWFITSCTNHPIIILVKSLLYKYWEENNRMIDYFLIHDFIELAIEAYPDEWQKVIPTSSAIPHILLLRLDQSFNEQVWIATKAMTAFHKLSWKFSEDQIKAMKCPGTFYDVVIHN